MTSFARALAAYEAMRAHRRTHQEVLDGQFREIVLASVRRKYPRRKIADFQRAGKVDPDMVDAIRQALLDAGARAWWDSTLATEKELATAVELAADGHVPIRLPDGQWTKYTWIYGGAYRSSGDRYGRDAAEMQAEHVRYWGVRAEVRDGVAGLDVWAGTDRIGVEAIKRKPSMTLREQVRRCWARCSNPRVFNPFLPHGYEEKVGIDYQGRETRRGCCLALVVADPSVRKPATFF